MIQALVAAGVANAPSHSFSAWLRAGCVRACVRACVCVCMQASDTENFDIGSEIMTNIILEGFLVPYHACTNNAPPEPYTC